MATDLALLRLLQLVSPGLPIGMYSYSQGLEKAVEDGLVTDSEEAREWIAAVLERSQTQVDLPLLARLYDAWLAQDIQLIGHWTEMLLACRETAELREEDRQTGQALLRLVKSTALDSGKFPLPTAQVTLATLFGFVAVELQIPRREALIGYCWSWMENQVLCAVKLVPLGQVAGQKLLLDLAIKIPQQVDAALRLHDDDIGGGVFGLALASSRHEMQYSRLFRS
jgi:urease accessory protein